MSSAVDEYENIPSENNVMEFEPGGENHLIMGFNQNLSISEE
jgi:hypothetical protein